MAHSFHSEVTVNSLRNVKCEISHHEPFGFTHETDHRAPWTVHQDVTVADAKLRCDQE